MSDDGHLPITLTGIADLVESQIPGTNPSRPGLYPIGTRVGSTMRDRPTGVITGYNQSAGPFYGADRYPYIIKWCDGYEDCYDIDGTREWVIR